MYQKRSWIAIMLVLLTNMSNAQGVAAFENGKSTSGAFLRNIIPPLPDAASIGKYGEQQINMFTGTPSVSIPIHEIKVGGASVQLSLSYSGSGLRVTEAASCVGLGWTLGGTGVITRVVRGTPDFTGNKDYFNVRTFPLPLSYSKLNDNAWNYVHSNIDDRIDPEPDLYIVHAGSVSIKFYYDQYKRIQTIPYNNQIQITEASGGYIVADESGDKYYFGGGNASEITYPEGANPYTSSWFITKIVSATGNEINFSYTKGSGSILQDQYSESEEVKQPGYGTGDCAVPTAGGWKSQWSYQTTIPSFLSTIETDNERVHFIRDSSQRADLPGDYALKEIKVYSKYSGKYIKQFQLDYSYFPQVSQLCWGAYSPPVIHRHDQSAVCKRLRLDFFIEKGYEGNSTGYKTYQFVYNTKPVPARCSLDQDHWGYYNGATNTSLLAYNSDPAFLGTSHNANSRESNDYYSEAGLLEKIIYPTGGETNFKYEPNEIMTLSQGQNPQSLSASLSGIAPQTEATAAFTLNSAQRINLVYDLDDQNLADQGLQRRVDILDQGGNVVFTAFNSKTPAQGILIPSISLPAFGAGTYTLRVSRNYLYSTYPNLSAKAIMATIYYNPQTTVTYSSRRIGGFRIRKISDKTSTSGNEMNVKEFTYDDAYLIANINSDSYKANYKRSFQNAQNIPIDCYFLSRNSSSVQPMGSIQGSHIGYGKVTTLYDTNGANGSSVSYFSTDPDAGGYSMHPVNMPVISYDHRRGNLLKKVDLNSAGEIVKITSNNYAYQLKYDGNFSRPYYVVDQPFGSVIVDASLLPYKQISFITFSMPSEFIKLVSSSETMYSGSDYITATKEYSYDNSNHNRTTKTKTVNSKGDVITESYTYPLDYKSSSILCKEEIERKFETDYQALFNSFSSCDNSAANATALNACYSSYQSSYDNLVNNRISALNNYQTNYINLANSTPDPVLKNRYKMIACNMLGERIETVSTRNQSQELNRTLNYFNDFNGFELPSQVNQSVSGNPLQSIVTFDSYDSDGNILQATSSDGIVQSYVWEYNKTLPVAQIANAAAGEVAQTSFESNGYGNFNAFTGTITEVSGNASTSNMPPTGKKYYNLTGAATISKSGLSVNKIYVVSYWSNSSTSFSISGGTAVSNGYKKGITVNGWTYHEHKITATGSTLTINGPGFIDEVRLYPDGAQMTSYTYEPLVGMTSQCDINNRTTYYEYDDFGRLNLVRSQDKNIIKKFCYNYAGQPTNCDGVVYYNKALSGTFTKNDCGPNSVGSNVTYAIAGNKYASMLSQADADKKAMDDAQGYANANGTCTSPYAQIQYTGVYNDGYETTGTVLIKFFKDAACTQPYSVSNLSVNYKSVRTNCDGSGTPLTSNYTITCNGVQKSLGTQTLSIDDGIHCWNYAFSVTSGTGYIAK